MGLTTAAEAAASAGESPRRTSNRPLTLDFVPLQALEEALNLHSPSSSQQPPGQANFADAANNLKKQELLTQIAVLKEQVGDAAGRPPPAARPEGFLFSERRCLSHQVKIFEEDFRKERSDRERMNEEKEDLRRQVERLQGQITNLTNQVTLRSRSLQDMSCCGPCCLAPATINLRLSPLSFIKHRTNARGNAQSDASWRDCRCSITNRYRRHLWSECLAAAPVHTNK